MHISEGVLSAPVLLGGFAVASVFTVIGFKKLKNEDIPATAVMSSMIFVASFIHIPIGPASTHLVLNGLTGAVLGILAFPAVLIALLLQALLFQFGGLTTLGVTTFNIALPALLAGFLFQKINLLQGLYRSIGYFIIGFISVFLSAIMVAITLALSGDSFIAAAKLLFVAHIPVMIIEGIMTMFILNFIHKMKLGVRGFDKY